MLTPAFELSQNDKYLFVDIQVAYAKISDVEIHFEDNDFMFYSKPYYLRLNLPGKVTACDEPSVKYDYDKRIFTVQAPKAQEGEVFEGLDLLTLLLSSKKAKSTVTPKIEVFESHEDIVDVEDDFDWSIEQIPSEDKVGNIEKLLGKQCGFASTYSNSIFSLKEEVLEIFDVTEIDMQSNSSHTAARKETELKHFNAEHYLADLYEDEEIQQLIKYRPPWDDISDEIEKEKNSNPDTKIHFTKGEKDHLRNLPNKEYLLDKSQVKTAFLGIIDILFAYAYNKRTTEGENTVESGWTINKISSTLSWLAVFHSVQDVAKACIRRSLSYPLYRHFELSITVLDDVRKILLLGRKYIIKCFVEIHDLFNSSEPRYILNDLFITDYCVWLQSSRCSSTKFVPLAEIIGKILLTKGDIGLNLVDIETFAKIDWMGKYGEVEDVHKEVNGKPLIEESLTQNSENDKSLCANLGALSLCNKDVEKISNSEESNKDTDTSSCSSDSNECSSSTLDTDSSISSDDTLSSSSYEEYSSEISKFFM